MSQNWKKVLLCMSILTVGCSVSNDGGDEESYEYYEYEGGPRQSVNIWIGPGWYNGVWFNNHGDWDRHYHGNNYDHRGDGGRREGGRGGHDGGGHR